MMISPWVMMGCGPTVENPPPADPPTQPLVIGMSPPSSPILVATDPDPAQAGEPVAPVPSRIGQGRDPRVARPPRARALVVTEVAQLENLFAATTAGAPDRPLIARRIADDYAEIERTGAGVVAIAARKSAIRYYELVTTLTPQHPAIDEAYYYLALEYELSGDLTAARKGYFTLIQRSPQSKLIPLAYYAFAEMFFAEGASDPSKYDLAEQAYRQVLKYPAPQNAVFTEAKDRLDEIAKLRGVTRP
jgi:tetratricopeptide (TPR) repeat protein